MVEDCGLYLCSTLLNGECATLAIVGLTQAGASDIEVAKGFGLISEYLFRLKTRAVEDGLAALVSFMGRLRTLRSNEVARAYALSVLDAIL